RWRSECGQADPEPACARLVAVEQAAQRLDADVGGQDEEAECNQLLRAALGPLGADPGAAKEPEDDQAGDCLDQAVCAEADQRDRAGGEPRNERDSELEHGIGDSAPGKKARPTLEVEALPRR